MKRLLLIMMLVIGLGACSPSQDLQDDMNELRQDFITLQKEHEELQSEMDQFNNYDDSRLTQNIDLLFYRVELLEQVCEVDYENPSE